MLKSRGNAGTRRIPNFLSWGNDVPPIFRLNIDETSGNGLRDCKDNNGEKVAEELKQFFRVYTLFLFLLPIVKGALAP